MLQLKPATIVRSARALFNTAHSDIIVFLTMKALGAQILNGVSTPIQVTSTGTLTEPLKYLCWINDSFEDFVETCNSENKFQNAQLPLPSSPQGSSAATKYSLFFPITTNARLLFRKSDSNRSVIWTRGVDDWRTENRYGIKPHESIIELLSKIKGQGAELKLRPDYVYASSRFFGPSEGSACSIPWHAFVIWCCRNEAFDQVPTFDEMARLVRQRLAISDEELHVLFVQTPEAPSLSAKDFASDRDDSEYNTQLCFGEPTLPTDMVLREAATVGQLKFESQLLGFTDTPQIKPFDLARRMWQRGNHNLLFVGAPRTSKSYCALRVAEDYLGISENEDEWDSRVLHIQFHQEWRYGDFIQKQIPQLSEDRLSVEPQAGVFLAHCRANSQRKSVVIIEEINRANVAAVFGESFYLIEMAYRGRQLLLPFGGGTLVIPDQLLLIATMNNVDRSTYPLDYALLARFRSIPFDVDYREMLHFLRRGDFSHTDALRVIADMRQISELTRYPIGQAHFVGIKNKADLYDWYITVLRPSLQLFLTKYQENVVTGQVDPIMERYRA